MMSYDDFVPLTPWKTLFLHQVKNITVVVSLDNENDSSPEPQSTAINTSQKKCYLHCFLLSFKNLLIIHTTYDQSIGSIQVTCLPLQAPSTGVKKRKTGSSYYCSIQQ